MRWRQNARPLLVVGVVLLAWRFVVPLVSPGSPEDLERDSALIGWTSPLDSDHIARDIADRVNDERVARGLQRLHWHDGLAELARQWSEEMISNTYGHSPESFRVLPDLHGIGENIIMGSRGAGDAHVGWMQSDGHRTNLLIPSYEYIGVGVVCRNDGRLWATQLFGMLPSAFPSALGVTPPVEPIVRQDRGPVCPASRSGWLLP